MSKRAKDRPFQLKRLIEEQARDQNRKYVYPEISTPQGGALFDLLTERQIAAVVLGRLLGPKRSAMILDISVSGIEKHMSRAEQKLSLEQRLKLKKVLKIISAMN